MADKASSSSSASVFLDEIKAGMSGQYNYEPAVAIAASSGEGWIFCEQTVDETASTNILATSDNFMGGVSAVALADKLMWVAIKNTSTTSTEGIGFCIDGGNAAYNANDTIIVGPEELVMFKVPNSTVDELHVRSCTLDGTYGYPTGQGTADIVVQVAAILKNVG